MKLITEYVENGIECLIESTDSGKKYAIEGIFAQAEQRKWQNIPIECNGICC